MNKMRNFRIETGFYLLAFLAAVIVRFIHLGSNPLNDAEAHLALQALAASRGEQPLLTNQPFLVLINTVLFFVFGSSNFLARFIPALFGGLFAICPILFQKHLGKISAVVLAFSIALDPALVAVSRQVDATGIAIMLLITAVGFFLHQQAAFAGICLGLALLCGPSIWMGMVILLIVIFLNKWFLIRKDGGDSNHPIEVSEPYWLRSDFLRILGIWCAGTFLVIGTMFLFIPNGISSSISGLISFVRGWWTPSGIRIEEIFIGLLAYSFFPLAFALWRVLSNLRSMDQTDRILITWFGIALLINVLYPGREIKNLVWAVLPVWVLTCRQIALLFPRKFEEYDFWYTLGLATFMFLVLCFVLFNSLSLMNRVVDAQTLQIRIVAVIGGLVIILLSAVLARWGWSEWIASYGLAWSMSTFLLISTLAVTGNALSVNQNKGMEMWITAPEISEAELLHTTISDLSEWSRGDRSVIDIALLQQDSPSLMWVLRGFSNTSEYTGSLPVGKEPSLVITNSQSMLQLGASYTGQDFNWQIRPAWQLYSAQEWLSWMFYRQAPVQNESIILWVRSDLFPGAVENVTETESDTLITGE